MFDNVRPCELGGIEPGQPIEVVRTDCPDLGTHYKRLKRLVYFEGADDMGLYVSAVHPPAYDDMQYIKFGHNAPAAIRRLVRI